MVKMKNFTEQDRRITKDLEKYQLAPPSPDLHDRVLRAARGAMARSEDAELSWSGRWLAACRAFRQEILAFASALMLILAVVMQLGIGRSALAHSKLHYNDQDQHERRGKGENLLSECATRC